MLMYLKPRIQGLAMTLEALARALGGRVLTAIFVIACCITAANLDDCLGEEPGEGEGEDDAGMSYVDDGEGEGEGEGEDEGMSFGAVEPTNSRAYMQLDETIPGLRYYGNRPYRTTCFQFDIER